MNNIKPVSADTEIQVVPLGHKVGLDLIFKSFIIAKTGNDCPTSTACRLMGIMLSAVIYGKVAEDIKAEPKVLYNKDPQITTRIIDKIVESAYIIVKDELYDQPQPSEN
jgi:hypothetical protein